MAVSCCLKSQLFLTEGPNLVDCLALARLKSVIFPWIFFVPPPSPVRFLRLAHLCTESANTLVINSFYLGPRNPLRAGVLRCQGCWHSCSAFIAHGQMPCKIPFAFAALGLTNMEGGRGTANVTTLSKMSLELNWRLDELIPITANGKPDCKGSRWLQLPWKEQRALRYVPALHWTDAPSLSAHRGFSSSFLHHLVVLLFFLLESERSSAHSLFKVLLFFLNPPPWEEGKLHL